MTHSCPKPEPAVQIALRSLRFHAFHGCLPQERTVGNDYTVDVRLTLPAAPEAVEQDRLEGTVNYAEVYELVRQEMQIPSRLIEHVAGRILSRIFRTFPAVQEAVVTVCKHNPPIGACCDGAAVTLRRTRQ